MESPLDPDQLIARARAQARAIALDAQLDPDRTADRHLDAPAQEALRVLCTSLNTEAGLNANGLGTLSRILRRSLAQRLLVDETLDTFPAITSTPPRVVNICGLPRTGTTALHFLFAQEPGIRVPRAWEATAPVPAPDQDHPDDPRIERTRQVFDLIDTYMPEFAAMHVQTADGPVETLDLLMLSLRTHNVTGLARVPSYLEWFAEADKTPSYEAVRAGLQVLQWRWPPSTWVIKSPSCTTMLDSIEAALPGTRHIWCHRDPAAAIPSVCSLIEHSRAANTDNVDRHELGREVLDYFVKALDNALAFRNTIGESRFVDLTMDEFVADPVAATTRVGLACDLPVSDAGVAAMTHWIGTQQRPANPHRYTAVQYGLQPDEIRARFSNYLDRFELRKEKVS